MADYTILAAPRISRRTFAAVLLRAGSPAAGAADDAYDAAVSYGVDPAVLLAVFQHESNYGRAGVARSSRSWGNLRRSPSYPTVDGFARYPTWAAGAADTARLLRVYGKSAIRPGKNTSTVQTFPYVWAPTGDGNAPDRYGDALVRAINAYRELGRKLDAAPVGPTHRNTADGARIRAAAKLGAPVLRTVPVGALVRATTVAGGTYRHNGHSSNRWLRITAMGGHALPAPVYSAALLWIKL